MTHLKTAILVLLIGISTHLSAQTDSCICGETVKGILILKNNYDTEVRAHSLTKESLELALENEVDLKKSLQDCRAAYTAVELALSLEKNRPKVVQVINTGWKWFEISGLAIITATIGFVAGHWIWQR